MRAKRWYLLGAGACLFQLLNCQQLAGDTVVRIGTDLIFLPINNAIVTLFSLA